MVGTVIVILLAKKRPVSECFRAVTLCRVVVDRSGALHGAKLWLCWLLRWPSEKAAATALLSVPLLLLLRFGPSCNNVLSQAWGKELCFYSGAAVATANQRTYNGVKRPPKKVRAAKLLLLQSYYYTAVARIWFVMAFLSPFSAGIKITTRTLCAFKSAIYIQTRDTQRLDYNFIKSRLEKMAIL